MIYLVFIAGAALSLPLLIHYVRRQKRRSEELSQKVQELQNRARAFFEEYADLTRQYVSEEAEHNFIARWHGLCAELKRLRVPKRCGAFSELARFKETYKNLRCAISESNIEIIRKEKLGLLSRQMPAFFAELSAMTSQYVPHSRELQFSEKWSALFQEAEAADIHSDDSEFAEIRRFISAYTSLRSRISDANEQFVKSESERYDYLLSDIGGKSLDEQQRAAVVTDEDRILVLAGAGSGKTLTIAAKVGYLCAARHIQPEEILLVAFTRKAAQELSERIQSRLGIPVQAATFHKLGLDILKSSCGRRFDVSDENALNAFVHGFFEGSLLHHPDLVKDLTEYFAYFLEVPKSMELYDSLGELYEEEKAADLETLKSKYEREKYIREAGAEKARLLTTLNNEKVRSREETKIANFLFMHGVRYEYERPYPFESNDLFRKPYRPDFYLSDYDIYLEHFGISKDGAVPWLSPIEERKYLDGIEWKRKTHKEHGTRLIETYSWYNSEGILLKRLEEILSENGVALVPRDFSDVFNTVYASRSNKYFSEFIRLLCTFITLFKSNNYNAEQIETLRHDYMQREANTFLRERTNLFLDIVKIILSEYQRHLSESGVIDFSDMINLAAGSVASCNEMPMYKYIIVDEYQDVSKARFHFLKAILDKTGAKLFCVGDDWQSIYRFAGSDISLFTDFEKHFGHTKILKLERTYRNSQSLIDEASRFVMKNPLQLKKDVRSDKSLDYPLVFWGFDGSPGRALHLAIQKSRGFSERLLQEGKSGWNIFPFRRCALNSFLFTRQRGLRQTR